MTDVTNQFDGICFFADPDPNEEYWCSRYVKSKGFTKLIKWVLLTKKHPFLEKKIKSYLKKHPEEINKQNEEGHTALMLASFNTNVCSTENTVKILIDGGADLNLQDKFGQSPFSACLPYIGNDSTENTVNILLEAKIDLNIQSIYGNTVLMHIIFCHNGPENIIKMLIEEGIDVNIQNEDGDTALMLCIKHYSPNKNIIKMLTECSDLELKNNNNETALDVLTNYVISKDKLEIVKSFLK